ncbi:MAG TPA: cysteine hydrolase family protein [Pseudoneobacillus sp.]|nr:cysteine hydrolase family protein [Pseudoneobacillus sp.]
MEKKALLIIDVQVGMFLNDNPVHNGKQLLNNIKYLIAKARATNTPIFYIQHNEPAGEQLEFGSSEWEIHPELSPTEIDVTIHKSTPDSFFNTLLDEELKKRSINHLVLTGIQSDLCVDTTTRRAFSMNYEVTLATDSHSTWGSGELTAQQIIHHHNQVLYWFANTKKTSDIEF